MQDVMEIYEMDIRPAQFIPIDAWVTRSHDELVVLLESSDNVRDSIVVPVRRIQDTMTYEVMVAPRRLWDTWKGSNSAMRQLGFYVKKMGGRWVFRWRG